MSIPEGAAPRRRRPLFDPRLLIGVLLVAASVTAVMGIVAAADRRTIVYAAAAALTPGDRIDVSDLVRRSVALDGADGLYLADGDIPSDGLVVTQPVASGELLPASAVGSSAGVSATSLVLELATRASDAVRPGASVDVWTAPPARAGSLTDAAAPLPPTVLVSGATVVRLVDDEGALAAKPARSAVELLVPRSRVARLLAAIAAGDALAVVPAGLPLRSGS